MAVLWGEGGAFCSGWDLKFVSSLLDDPKKLDDFREGRLTTWLYRIGFNCAIDYLRGRPRREAAEPHEVAAPDGPPERPRDRRG